MKNVGSTQQETTHLEGKSCQPEGCEDLECAFCYPDCKHLMVTYDGEVGTCDKCGQTV